MQQSSPPRILLLTSPSLYGAIVMNTIGRQPGLDLVGVGLTNRLYKGQGPIRAARTFLKRTGWAYVQFGFMTHDLAWTILRAKGQPRGVPNFRQTARLIADVNSPDTLDWMRERRPDYVASFYFNQWIGADVRAIPARGCVNLHPSRLPELRGPDPIFRALERGLTTTGLTIHTVADGFDAGSILHQELRTVPPDVSALGLYVQQVREGSQMLAEWLAGNRPQTSTAGSPPLVQPAEKSSEHPGDDYNTFPTPTEVRNFLRSGKRLYSLREWWQVLREIK